LLWALAEIGKSEEKARTAAIASAHGNAIIGRGKTVG
jgi:hypothetical protein